jgi:protein-S-isoprenylcysteine O-methyltransferase Ste14
MKNPKSTLLVILQLTSLFFIFLTGELIPADPFVVAMVLIGIFLGLWAFYALRATKFSILPELPENAALVTAGPYTIIRHPMYTSMLIIGQALVLNEPTFPRIIALLVLIGVLLVKTEVEEQYLDRHFKEYGAYKEKTKKLIPYLY